MPLQVAGQSLRQEFAIATFDVRTVSLFADDDAGLNALRAMALASEARVVATRGATAAEVAETPLGQVVLVELREPPTDAQDIFLTLIDARAEDAGARLLVACQPESIDLVFARTAAERTDILARASDVERQLALASAFAQPNATVVSDLGNEDGVRIQRLADEVSRIAKSLAELAEAGPRREGLSDALVGFRASPFLPSGEAGGLDPEEIRAMIRLRRLRDRFFDSELFADPAWDMLLDLMAARLERTKVSVSSLCIAAAVPPTTALRWIKTMTDQKLFKRVQDPHDARRVFIELGDEAAAGMRRYLLAAKATGGMAV